MNRLYFQSRKGDFSRIVRWSPDSATKDTVASFFVSSSGGSNLGPGGIRITRVEDTDPFPSEPDWTVSRDGRIAIAFPDPYHVEIITPGRGRIKGPIYPFDPVEVTDGHKEAWAIEMRRPRTVVVGRMGSNAPQSTYETRSIPVIFPSRWPRFLPPFLKGASSFSPSGELWINRTVSAGDSPVFDVFNRTGVRVGQVALPVGRRLLGFGPTSVFATFRDEFDLEYLERYDLDFKVLEGHR